MLKTNVIYDEKTKKIVVEIPAPPFEPYVFEGAGVKGTAYAGCLKVLEKYGLSDEVKQVAGSSAGSIVALAVAIGYSADEIVDILRNLSMDKFLEKQYPQMPEFLSTAAQVTSALASQKLSLSSGIKFHQWLEKLVEKKLGNKDATFEDLKNAIEKQEGNRLKPLFVRATNTTTKVKHAETLCYQKTPKMPLALAVLASSAFPLVFEPVTWDGKTYIDGGVMDNLPLSIFDKEEYVPSGYTLMEGKNPSILAIKIDTKYEREEIEFNIR